MEREKSNWAAANPTHIVVGAHNFKPRGTATADTPSVAPSVSRVTDTATAVSSQRGDEEGERRRRRDDERTRARIARASVTTCARHLS